MARSIIISVNALLAAKPTAIGIAALPSPIRVNQVFTVKGNLYDTTSWLYVNVPGKTLHVSYDGVVVADVVTGAAGYSLQMSIPTAGTYRVRVDFDGDADYLPCYHETPEFTVTKIPTVISIEVNPTSGTVPFTVRVSGKLIDSAGVPIDGRFINLYSNGILVGTTTSAAGYYAFSADITAAGTYQFQTEFPGDDTYEGCTVHNGARAMSEVPQLPWGILGLLAVGVLVVVSGKAG